jgi:hypothetical protein
VSFAAIIANWKLITIGLLVAVLGVQTLRLSWAQNELISDKLAQAEAVKKAQERADALSNELVIQQAIAMARTEKVVIEYRDRIRNAPNDVERNRAGSVGVRDILRGNDSPPK